MDFQNSLRSRVIVDHVPFANGISISSNGKTLALASTSTRSVWIYRILGDDYDSLRLEFIEKFDVEMNVDNVSFLHGSDNKIIATGHPNPLALIGQAKSPNSAKKLGGSKVVMIDLEHSTIQTIFIDSGQYFSSSSTAIGWEDGRMIVSGLYETKGILDCKDVAL